MMSRGFGTEVRSAVALLGLLVWMLGGTARARAEGDRLEEAVDRRKILDAAVRDHPALRAAEERARATRAAADAEGRLPPPEAMVQIWQVPLARPYAIGDAQMIMFGLGQSFPA